MASWSGLSFRNEMRVARVIALCAALVACAQVLDLGALTEIDASMSDVVDTDACQGACNPSPQHACGCKSYQNCAVMVPTGTTFCAEIGNKPLWSHCDESTYFECQRGAQCVDSVCKPFCESSADCSGNRVCRQIMADGAPVPGLRVCTAGCDLLNPSAVCEPNVTCNPVPWDGSDHGDCFGEVGSGIGAGACLDAATSCAPGYSCIVSTGTCAKWCRLAFDDCDAGSDSGVVTCMPVTNIDGTPYGLCQ